MRDRDTAPAEGLPPCLSVAQMGSRIAILRDAAACGHTTPKKRLEVAAGVWNGRRDSHKSWASAHPEFEGWQLSSLIVNVRTDDPAEAQAAFERGAKWVRTGEGP